MIMLNILYSNTHQIVEYEDDINAIVFIWFYGKANTYPVA